MGRTMTEEEWEDMWARRDATRAKHEALMEAQAQANRNRLVAVVEAALKERCAPCAPFDITAHVAITALEADGVVFARLGTWEEDDDDID